jgi:fluoride exporter
MESAFECFHADDSCQIQFGKESGMSRLLLFVGVGGFIGSVLRYTISGYVQQLTRSASFSYGTIVVNVVGCLIIGILSQLVDSYGLLTAETRALLITGFLGGFTTFSTFSNETLNLFRDSENLAALLNIGVHIFLGLGAVWMGRTLALLLWR